MAPDAESIVALYKQRRQMHQRRLSQMEEVKRAYEGDLDLPLPELDRTERPMVANLISQGVDQTANRIASTMPNVTCPPLRPGFEVHEQNAADRRQAIYGLWTMNRLNLVQRKRARWLITYAAAPVMIRPDPRRCIPFWHARSPLTALPPPGDDLDPPDMIFSFKKTLGWLKKIYPEHVAALDVGRSGDGGRPSPDIEFTIVEYCDDEVMSQVVLGRATESGADSPWTGGPVGRPFVELDRLPNKAGICPAVNPTRIGLDAPQGQFDGVLGLYWNQAMLMALEAIAVKRSIFPDRWIVGRQGETPQIINEADGVAGVYGEIQGASIQDMPLNPGVQTYPTLDRLERAIRLSAGIPSEMTGECQDAETEIFTAEGWRHYDEVSVGTEVLTLNPRTGLSEWQPILKMNVFPAQPRPMMRMESRGHSSLSTLNHRWLVQSLWNKNMKWVTSERLTGAYRIPIAAHCADLPTEAKWSDDLVELVAWHWTEGTLHHSNVSIAKSATKYPQHYERIRAVLLRLFGPATEKFPHQGRASDGIPRWRELKPNRTTGVGGFYLSSVASAQVTEHAPGKEKVPTPGFLRSLTAAQLELFLHVSMLADNCGKGQFGQKSRSRAEAFGYAAVLAGHSVSYHSRTRSDNRAGHLRDEYTTHVVTLRRIRWANPKENAQRGSGAFERVVHDGTIWCPTTPNSTWLARRRGTVFFTGNSATNIRTARRGAQVLSSAIDFGVQEMQEVFEASLEEENSRAIAIDKAYFGAQTKSFYFSWNGVRGRGEYVPNDLWTSDENQVSYSFPGADMNQLVVGTGQRIGMETMSHYRAMELDPLVEDPDLERDRITGEGLERAFMQGLQAQVSQGQIPPDDAAFIVEQVVAKRVPLFQAVQRAQKRAQDRQASQESVAPAEAPMPLPPGAPEVQPGLAAPGMGAEAAAIPEPAPSMGNLQALMNQLRRTSTPVG